MINSLRTAFGAALIVFAFCAAAFADPLGTPQPLSCQMVVNACGSQTFTRSALGTPALLNGSGAPSSTLGAVNDYYIRIDNGTLYQKVAGTWTPQVNFTGAPAPAVASIAALQALQALPATPLVAVTGYYAPGDGGGGLFRWVAGDATTADGGLVIAPTAGGGRYFRVFDGSVDVRWYGAKGDGTTDDTAAIAAALVTGKPVFLSQGAYVVTQALSVPANSALTGTGPGSQLLIASDQRGVFVGADNVMLSGFRVTGSGAPVSPQQGRAGIHVEGANWVTISDVIVENVRSTGIGLSSGSHLTLTNFIVNNTYEHGVYSSLATYVTISNGSITNAGQNSGVSAYGLKISGSSDFSASNIVVRNPLEYGVAVVGPTGQPTARIHLANVSADSNGSAISGLKITDDVSDLTVTGGTFTGDYGAATFSDTAGLIPARIHLNSVTLVGQSDGFKNYYGAGVYLTGGRFKATNAGAYGVEMVSTAGSTYATGVILEAEKGIDSNGSGITAEGCIHIGSGSAFDNVAGGTWAGLATAVLPGAVPPWPSNTTTYFRGDGTYATLNVAAVSGAAPLASPTFTGTVTEPNGAAWSSTGVNMPSGSLVSWNGDTILQREAANSLGLRNGTNAQTYWVYNTSSSANANYERGGFTWDTNVFDITVGAAGTGSSRDFGLIVNGSRLFQWHGSGAVMSYTGPNNGLPLTLGGYSLTGSTALPTLQISPTWNTSGNPTAFLVNVTRAAVGSNTSAYLADWQIGGASVFKVDTTGIVYSNGTPGLTCSGTPTSSFASTNGIVTHC